MYESRINAATLRLQRLIDDYVDVLGNIAVSVAIETSGGRTYLTAGHADLSRKLPASKDCLYQIGSQTKTVVALSIIILCRRGVLELDASVRRYVDLPIDERITLRHILMNTSGLGEILLGMPLERLDPRIEITPRDLVALALPQGQIFEPGERFDYSNTGWVIAGMIIEAVCTMDYGQVIDNLVVQPLGLKDTYIGGGAPVERMMKGYVASGATAGLVDISDCHQWAFGGGDGVSTLDDMLVIFGSLIREDSPLGISLLDLSSVTAKPSEAPYIAMSIGTEYGLGIERRAWAGSEVWGHPGSTLGYLSGTWIDPAEGVTVTTCVTQAAFIPSGSAELQYPRAQLFAMALSTGYLLAAQ